MKNYPITQRNKVIRSPRKASYDPEVIHAILDEAMVCHVACQSEQGSLIQPTLHWRVDEVLYIHGSSKNGLFQQLLNGAEASIAVTLLDGIVFARSAFHHSVNYRSVILYGKAYEVTDEVEKRASLDALMEKFHQGRSKEARPANDTELKATSVLAFKLENISAKVRTGGPVDDPEDMTLPVWAGVQPITLQLGDIVYE